MLLLVDPAPNPIVRRTKSNLHQFHTLLLWIYTNLQYLPLAFESILHLLYVLDLTRSAAGISIFSFFMDCTINTLYIINVIPHVFLIMNQTWHWVLIFHLSTQHPHKLFASPDCHKMTLHCFFQLSEQHKKFRLNVRAQREKGNINTEI